MSGLADTESDRRRAPLLPSYLDSPGRWGMIDDYVFWRAVFRLYDADELQGAYELAQSLGAGMQGRGVGWFRLIEAEYVTATKSDVAEIKPWMKLEFIPDEIGDRVAHLTELIHDALARDRERFKWSEEIPTWITFLSNEFDAEWQTHRYGYCSEKRDYYKICLPHHALLSDTHFIAAISHEFAHVISLSISKRRIPNWVGEGFSVVAARELSGATFQRLASRMWRGPDDLERAIGAHEGAEEFPDARWLAYQQAGWILNWLAQRHGEPSLVRFVSDFGDESLWRNLKYLLLPKSRLADCLRRNFGISLKKLFDSARTQASH